MGNARVRTHRHAHGRPEAKQRQEPAYRVLAKEFSRLMRPEDSSDYALLQHFINTETILYLPDGPIDFASKVGRLIGPIRAVFAGVERRDIVERMRDAKEAMRTAGKHPGGNNTLGRGVGYNKERGWYYTDEMER